MAERISRALRANRFQPDELAQLDELKRTSGHPCDVAQSAELLEKAQEPPDPMESYADEAENKLEQDLMLLSNGHRTRDLLRRLKQYKDFIVSPGAENTEFAQKYKQRIQAASAAPAALGTYVPGDEIEGDELRKFSDEPIICGPLVFQLCNTDFISQLSFADHMNAHACES